jgi:hypothetical protein
MIPYPQQHYVDPMLLPMKRPMYDENAPKPPQEEYPPEQYYQ